MCLVSHIWQIGLKMIQFSEVPNCRSSVWVKTWAPLEIGQARHVKTMTIYAHFVWFPLNIYDPYPASFLPIVALFSLTRSESDLGFAAWGSAFRGPRLSSPPKSMAKSWWLRGKKPREKDGNLGFPREMTIQCQAERDRFGRKQLLWCSQLPGMFTSNDSNGVFFCDTWRSGHCFWYLLYDLYVNAARTHTCICVCVCVCVCAHSCLHSYYIHTGRYLADDMMIYIYIQFICTHTYIHTYIHTYTHTHIHTYIHTYMHACMHACIHTHIHTYTHTYIHTYIHTNIHTYRQTDRQTYIHTYTHTYIHICIYIYVYIYGI